MGTKLMFFYIYIIDDLNISFVHMELKVENSLIISYLSI